MPNFSNFVYYFNNEILNQFDKTNGNIKNNPKVIRAWTFYDWANSVYSLVITSTIFPIYFSVLTTDSVRKVYNKYQNIFYEEPIQSKIKLFGRLFEPDALFSYSLTLSFLFVVITTPVFSAIADTTGTKKRFLQFFCYMGSLSCMGLFFFTDKSNLLYGLVLNFTSSVGFWGSLVYYNSYLPEIADESKQNSVSAQGYIMGYIGSLLLLISCLVLIEGLAPETEKSLYTRICFLLTGLWWLGFAQYTFYYLPNNAKHGEIKKGIVKDSITGFIKIQKELFSEKNLKNYLLSFFFFSLGMQTIFLMATLFGKNEVNLESNKLIMTILLLQVEAIFGAYLCSFVAKKIGNKKVLIICICIWIFICLCGFFLDKTNPNIEYYFYLIAGLVGLVMGGIQSMSRSTFSKMLPKDNIKVSYFSFYDVFEKLSIVFGTFIYGYLIDLTGSTRYSVLAMSVSFVISLFFIISVHSKKLE